MLVIRRGCGESLYIGTDVEIEVLDISPSQVKLGIRAPKLVPVLRKEVLLTREANRAASQSATAGALCALIEKLAAQRAHAKPGDAGKPFPAP
jgi:carbon storage regulator